MSVSSKEGTFWDHVGTLRNHIVFGGVFFVLAVIIVFSYVSDYAIATLLLPLDGSPLVFLSPLAPLLFKMRISLWVALVMSIPVWLVLIVHFIGDALSFRQQVLAVVSALASALFGVGAAAVSYYYLVPTSLHFLTGITVPGTSLMITADSYLTFVLLILGVAFVISELPLFLVFLTSIGLLDPRVLMRQRRIVYLGVLLLLAFVTPTVDIASLAIVFVPTVVGVN